MVLGIVKQQLLMEAIKASRDNFKHFKAFNFLKTNQNILFAAEQ